MREVSCMVGADRAVGGLVGTVCVFMLMAEVLRADILEGNEVLIIAVPRSHKDFSPFVLVQNTVDCGTSRQSCTRQSWCNCAA